MLIALVADGASSAARGAAAAEAACVFGVDLIKQWFECVQSEVAPDEFAMRSWVVDIRQHVLNLALAEGTSPREWACTILGAVCMDLRSSFFQVGDGAIVVKDGAGLRPVFWPVSGEYINQTVFLTSPDALQRIALTITQEPTGRIALLSDGLQNLALDHKARGAHGPFFEPLFTALAASDDIEAYESRLMALLTSEGVNRRTDDDKTLVIAYRTQ